MIRTRYYAVTRNESILPVTPSSITFSIKSPSKFPIGNYLPLIDTPCPVSRAHSLFCLYRARRPIKPFPSPVRGQKRVKEKETRSILRDAISGRRSRAS